MLLSSMQGQMDNYVQFDSTAITNPVSMSFNDLATNFVTGMGSVVPENITPIRWANAIGGYGYDLPRYAMSQFSTPRSDRQLIGNILGGQQ